MYASPSQLIEYVRPLVDAGVFDFSEELDYRLRLGIDETEKASDWLLRMLDDCNCTLQEADSRNETVIKELTKGDITKFERYRRLAIFPKAAPILYLENLNHRSRFWNMDLVRIMDRLDFC